eukprot:scaffold105066_cov36-Phaeocystis_antarctica.AAC.1
MGSQPPSHGVAASITWGRSLHHMGLQPPSHGVAASITRRGPPAPARPPPRRCRASAPREARWRLVRVR